MIYYGGAGGTPGDTFTLRVPAGRYAVLGSSVAYYVDSDVLETTLAAEADLDVHGARERDARPGAGQAGDGDCRRGPTKPTRTDLTNVQTAPNGLSWWHQISGYGASDDGPHHGADQARQSDPGAPGRRSTWTRPPAPPSRTATTWCTSTRAAASRPTPPSG